MTSEAVPPTTPAVVDVPVEAASAPEPQAKPPADTRSPAQIEADLIATRERLAGRIDDLQQYVSPGAVAGRGLAKVKGTFVDEYGGIRPERVVVVAAVAAVLVGICVLRRRLR